MDSTNPKRVLFEPEYVGWRGLSFAIKDALSMQVPLAVCEKHKARVLEYVSENSIDIEVVIIDEVKNAN